MTVIYRIVRIEGSQEDVDRQMRHSIFPGKYMHLYAQRIHARSVAAKRNWHVHGPSIHGQCCSSSIANARNGSKLGSLTTCMKSIGRNPFSHSLDISKED